VAWRSREGLRADGLASPPFRIPCYVARKTGAIAPRAPPSAFGGRGEGPQSFEAVLHNAGRHRKRRLMRRAFSEARSILARRASAASCSSTGEGARSWATGAARNRLSACSSPAAENVAAMGAHTGLVH